MKEKGFFDESQINETLGNRSWLEAKSKNELVDLLMYIASEFLSGSTTYRGKLPKPELDQLEFGTSNMGGLDEFQRLPLGVESIEGMPTWEVILVPAGSDQPPLSLKISGDVVIGCKGAAKRIDLDLTRYGAKDKGVSRVHAVFQVTDSDLLISDLGSTNGTYVNKKQVGKGEQIAVKEKNILVFGDLYFKVKVVKRFK
ncbi:FHA domain-containing protein [Chloroflexota bacterium]